PENHKHGDRTPSVGIHERRNWVMCFVCDARTLSSIDLVMSVLQVERHAAVQWISEASDDLQGGKRTGTTFDGRSEMRTARRRVSALSNSLGLRIGKMLRTLRMSTAGPCGLGRFIHATRGRNQLSAHHLSFAYSQRNSCNMRKPTRNPVR